MRRREEITSRVYALMADGQARTVDDVTDAVAPYVNLGVGLRWYATWCEGRIRDDLVAFHRGVRERVRCILRHGSFVCAAGKFQIRSGPDVGK
jgi:hypothetical protein